jgi:hypothetical protein
LHAALTAANLTAAQIEPGATGSEIESTSPTPRRIGLFQGYKLMQQCSGLMQQFSGLFLGYKLMQQFSGLFQRCKLMQHFRRLFSQLQTVVYIFVYCHPFFPHAQAILIY